MEGRLVALATPIAEVAGGVFERVWRFLIDPILATPWGDWSGFWERVVFDDRLVVIYFLPLVPLLLLFRGDALRKAIIATSAAFLIYVFGALYAAFWLVTCVAFYFIGERFAIEAKRKDVLQIGPPLFAAATLLGWYYGSVALLGTNIPTETNNWLFEHLPWVFPLPVRLHWPVAFGPMGPAPLFATMFYNTHNIGMAYFLVRMLHYFAEIKRGGIAKEERGLLRFVTYAAYAPAMIQGPIERYPAFQQQIETSHERRGFGAVPIAFARIGWGVAKVLIGYWYLFPIAHDVLAIDRPNLLEQTYYAHPEQIESFWWLYFGVYVQIYMLYLEFSGYCDVSAGMARLIGYRQVENFDWPWFATSLRDFWRRWHISLSAMLRDYVYIALGGNRRHTTLNLCLTFGLCGFWHIPNISPFMRIWGIALVMWGVLMGLMLAVNQWWVSWMKRVDERQTGVMYAIRRGAARLWPLPQILAWAITMHFFVHSLLIFFAGPIGARNVYYEMFRRLWGAG
ncbi:MAG: hypothetical protein KDA32_03155 [Phycisphaerales bacterium]|nr:hypothetical protein [Phycisphaerales bacterium]